MFDFIKKFFVKTNEVQSKIDEVQILAQDKLNTVEEIEKSLEAELIETKEQLVTYKNFYSNITMMVKDIPVVLASNVKDETMVKLQHIVDFYKAQLVKVKAPRS